MKKTIAIIAALAGLIGIGTATAGTAVPRDEMSFGVKAGLNYANVYDTKGQGFDANGKFGMVGGGFLSIPFGSLIGVQTELLFSQKGFEGKGDNFGLHYNFKRTTFYVDVPIYFALKPTESITLLAGPQFSYLLSKKDSFTNFGGTVEQEEKYKNDNIRKNTAGVSLGVDVNVENLVFGVRTNWDLQKNNGDGTSTVLRYKNQWLQATVGFRF